MITTNKMFWFEVIWGRRRFYCLPEETGSETKANDSVQAELTEIFDNYNDRYDGAYAEGYGYQLGKLYNTSDKKLFIEERC